MTYLKKHPAFIIAGTNSSCGKTTVTLGIMEALGRRGIPVAPFKAGPDFIDPGHHRALLSRPSYNLDAWMMGPDAVKKTFYEKAYGCVGVIEGVMGLFDGKGGGAEGSTAQLAKILDIPVLLVVNAEKTAGSVWAVVKGFIELDPAVKIKWVVFNKAAGERHFNMILSSRPASIKTACLGYIQRDEALTLPERHLGLVTAGNLRQGEWKRFVKKAGDAIERGFDLSGLLNALPEYRPHKVQPRLRRKKPVIEIAVAADAAFSFYYEENLDILKDLGALIKPFSPLKDKKLPAGVSGIYIGGGYPELFAKKLEANHKMSAEIKRAARNGMPVYAECGGLMYLGRSIKDLNNKTRRMCGVFPWKARLLEKRKALGYREVAIKKGCPMMPGGGVMRGHEFHYSELHDIPSGVIKKYFSFDDSGKKTSEGFAFKNTLATYVHGHFASCPGFAEGFVGLCRAWGFKNGV